MTDQSLQAMNDDELLELLAKIEDTKARAEEVLLGRMSNVRQSAAGNDRSKMLPQKTTNSPHCS